MELKLPQTIISRIDVARVIREIETLNEYMVAVKVRQTGVPMQLPRLSRQLEDLARDNQRNLIEEAQRKELLGKLNVIIGRAPSVHISFAAEPSAKAVNRILLWFRESVDPQVLIQVGLQPNIAVGCVVRSPNLLFDLSMRQYLAQQEPYLTQLLKETARATPETIMGDNADKAEPIEGIAITKVKEVEWTAPPKVPETLTAAPPAKVVAELLEQQDESKTAPAAAAEPAAAPLASGHLAAALAPVKPPTPPTSPPMPVPKPQSAAVPLPLAAEPLKEKGVDQDNMPAALDANAGPMINVDQLAPVPMPLLSVEAPAEPENENAK